MSRIVHIIHGSPPESMGGTGLYVRALAAAQAEAGHQVAILSPNPGSPTAQHPSKDGVEHWAIQTDAVRKWTDTWDGSFEPWLRWCSDWKPSVVHFHHLSGWPLKMIEATPCRTVLTLHDYAIPCARGQLVREDLSRCEGPSVSECTRCLGPALRTHPLLSKAAQLLKPFPALTHLGKSVVGHTRDQDDRVASRAEAAQSAIDAVDVLLAPSRDLIERMTRYGFRSPEETTLPLLQQAVAHPEPNTGPVRFLYASSIIPTKGPDRLFQAFLRAGEGGQLSIAGHAPRFDSHPTFAADLEQAARKHPNIHWLGPIEPEDVPDLMAQHDVLVLPSIWPENSPLVVREATAAGLSVIVSALGGAGELAPQAKLINSDADLESAIKQAIQIGRMRHTPARWPTPLEHAESLFEGPYSEERA